MRGPFHLNQVDLEWEGRVPPKSSHCSVTRGNGQCPIRV